MQVFFIQHENKGSVNNNIAFALAKIDEASSKGAQIICTQELFLHEYFCYRQDTSSFNYAIDENHEIIEQFRAKSEERNIVLIIAIFEKELPNYYNSAIIFDKGKILGKYRKTHIPQDPYFEEKFYFTPARENYQVFKSSFGNIGILICWDQWFVEAYRSLSLQGADLILIPTAIGSCPIDDDITDYSLMWQRVQQGQAIANNCFVAAVNRIGKEETNNFFGKSFICDYKGNILIDAEDKEGVFGCKLNLEALNEHRKLWPFFRDRRIETYDRIS